MCKCPKCGSFDTEFEQEDSLTVEGWYCNECEHGPFETPEEDSETDDGFISDAEADENAMASAGMGEDESYCSCYGGGED